MARFPLQFVLPTFVVIVSLFPRSPCFAADAGALNAAPWKAVVGSSRSSMPREDLPDSKDEPPSEADFFARKAKLAEEGDSMAAVAMAKYSQYKLKDGKNAVYWLRMAVRNGNVESAWRLGELYFPVGGTLGRENFLFQPDAVMGYVWYAIGLSGMRALEKGVQEPYVDKHSAEELVDALRTLLLPSERARAAAILSRWPESLPPDIPLESMLDKDGGDNESEKSAAAAYDENMVVEQVRLLVTGKIKNWNGIGPLFILAREFPLVPRKAFEQMQALAAAGDAEAEYMVAWCQFNGLGTEVDAAAAVPFLETKADVGDPEAIFLMAIRALNQDDRDRAIELATRAAERGHGRAMMLASSVLGDRDEDKQRAAQWMEKAAETGEPRAIEEMISIAESSQDRKKIVQWLTIAMLRTSDPAKAYRCRMLIAYVGLGSDEEELQAAMENGERWHSGHHVVGDFPIR